MSSSDLINATVRALDDLYGSSNQFTSQKSTAPEPKAEVPAPAATPTPTDTKAE